MIDQGRVDQLPLTSWIDQFPFMSYMDCTSKVQTRNSPREGDWTPQVLRQGQTEAWIQPTSVLAPGLMLRPGVIVTCSEIISFFLRKQFRRQCFWTVSLLQTSSKRASGMLQGWRSRSMFVLDVDPGFGCPCPAPEICPFPAPPWEVFHSPARDWDLKSREVPSTAFGSSNKPQ